MDRRWGICNQLYFVAVLSFMLMTFCGCGTGKAVNRVLFNMDTVMDISVYGKETDLDEAEKMISDLDLRLSVTNRQSEIYRINHHEEVLVSDETKEIIEKACELSRVTNGAMDISIYPIVNAWGFTGDEKRVPDEEKINELLAYVNYEKVEDSMDDLNGNFLLPDGVEIDLGCIAKGYTGDKVIELLKSNGVEHAIISLGGNIHTLGKRVDEKPWRVAIVDPDDTKTYIGTVDVSDKVVITSGAYQRFFEEDGVIYHHIIDPSTGYPANSGLKSVTLIGESGTVCDALSTAFYVMGLDKLTEWWSENGDAYCVDAIIVDDRGTVYVTEGIKDDFTLMGDHSIEVINK